MVRAKKGKNKCDLVGTGRRSEESVDRTYLAREIKRGQPTPVVQTHHNERERRPAVKVGGRLKQVEIVWRDEIQVKKPPNSPPSSGTKSRRKDEWGIKITLRVRKHRRGGVRDKF